MWNCGLDCHEESIRICVVDREGARVLEEDVRTESGDLEALLGPYAKEGLRVALEASSVSFAVHDRMVGLGCRVYVWPPKKLRVIAESKAKCDRNDARWLAELLRTGFHPVEVYIPSPREREIRNLLNLRQTAVRMRVRILQSARSLMVKGGRKLPRKSFSSMRGWTRLLAEPDLSDANRFVLEEMYQSWRECTGRIGRLDEALDNISRQSRESMLLRTIPGVGPVTSLWMSVGLGDPHRFRRSREVGSYLGMVPSNSSSGKVRRHGHITKEGKTDVRNLWIQAAHAYLRSDRTRGQGLRRWFEVCSRRRGRKIAVVGLARKLMVIAWHMMKEERAFRPEEASEAA